MWSWVSSPPLAEVSTALSVGCVITGSLATLGIRVRATLPLFAVLFLTLTTLDQCWSRLEENRIFTCLMLLMLSSTHCADALAVDARAPVEPHARYRWPLHAIAVLWGTILFVAAVSKLRTSGWAWVDSDNLRHILVANNLGMADREPGVVALWWVEHPVLCRVAAGITLASELAVLSLVLTKDRRAILFAGVLSASLLFGFWWLLRVPQTPHALGLLAVVDWDAVMRWWRPDGGWR